jgi:hypothetical protein
MTTESKPKRTRAPKPTNEEVQTAILKEKTEPSWFNCSHGETFESVNARWAKVHFPADDERWARVTACWDCQGPMLRADQARVEDEFCTRCSAPVEAMEVEG